MTLPRTSRIPRSAPRPGRTLRNLLLVLAASTLPAFSQVITQTEQDDSFSTANPTGLDSTHTGLKVAYGNSADGAYGYEGDGTGDFDFYKLSAAAGQVITVDLKNNSLNDDFDSYVAVYKSDGTVVAQNDDATGSGRASKLSYTVATAGDYYVCVSNWVNLPDAAQSLPADPTKPGTGYGLPGGTGGPYKVFIGLNASAPIIQFDGGISGNPVPTIRWVRILGGVGYSQAGQVALTNTGTAPYTLTNLSFSGLDAAKFSLSSPPTLPLTLPVGSSVILTLVYTGNGTHSPGTASLDFTSNDPLDASYALSVPDSNITGGGTFTVKQVNAASGTTIGSMADADALLAGTKPSSSTITVQSPVINFLGSGGGTGYFGGDSAFPNAAAGADNFVLQATGNFFVKTAGTYSFRGYSDDGQRLLIDGNDVLDSGPNTATWTAVDLTAGIHSIQYTMYEAGGGEGAELAVSQYIGPFYAYTNGQTTWELLEAYSADADGDGLPDSWESSHGLNPNDATGANGATGDPDNDGLSNLGEYIAGTDPQNPDTDGDGLKDGVETNTGVWVSASNTGTDPLNPDSDGDGLKDSVEDPTKAFVDINQPGTDPNKADTDGDGYGDLSEIALGTNPKLASSVPSFTYSTILADNFDGVATASTYAFTNTTGTAPAITATSLASNGNAVQITSATASNNNSIAWDQVAAGSPQSLKISVDFRIGSTNPADGFGFGLFRTSAYGTTGANNPAAANKNWENPATNGGYPDAVAIGFGIYGTNYIRLAGPAAPGVALSETISPFTLSNDVFNRAILTATTNGSSGTLFSLTLIQDVNGASPTTRQIFTNVLVPGFDLPNEQFRLIAGGRTGGLFTRIDLDNVKVEKAGTSSAVTPTISIAKTTGQPVVTYTGVLQSSTDLGTFTDVAGAASPYTVPAGSPVKLFFRARQP